ncbi:hypothetical protein HETIRDRAFT_420234 [Heterobasidion irregulare TC 32-1]|uniref:Uncharacterized protein n=1 Tax=Heterobasidion irregulare (strain TC 32-1) TaxID=747525 RepID=W4JZT2_HETIT|nr:uncharacterized protein HETIRDRAFT_420234 [Heterobasidion irregulare TC 32-1]ETW79057.1 hypothetical protein HETIRDRAFT_420234 [Heterobasidion irregulare TC 32-1]
MDGRIVRRAPIIDSFMLPIHEESFRPRACTKLLERRIVNIWKRVTRAMRAPERTSMLPEDFVLMNARRRSLYIKNVQ